MPIYDRQELIEGLRIPEVATVVGCGGTGFWTAMLLAMSGTSKLILIDFDKIEESNLNRIPLENAYIGYNKTDAVEVITKWIRPRCELVKHKKRLETPESCAILEGTVFCCTDNIKSQQLINAHCKKNNLPYQRIGYDGTLLNVSRAFPMTFDDDVKDGYRVVPSWAIPAVMAAALGIFSQCKDELTITEDISTLHCADSTIIPPAILKREIKKEAKKLVPKPPKLQVVKAQNVVDRVLAELQAGGMNVAQKMA